MGIPAIDFQTFFASLDAQSLLATLPSQIGQYASFFAWFLLIGAMGAAFLAFFAGFTAKVAKKPLLAHLSRQATTASLFFYFCYFLAFCGLLAFLAIDETMYASAMQGSFLSNCPEICLQALHRHLPYFAQEVPLGGIVLFTLFCVWLLKRTAPQSVIVLFCNLLAACLVFVLVFWWATNIQQDHAPLTALRNHQEMLASALAPVLGKNWQTFATLLGWYWACGLAVGGLLLMLWFFLRRNSDDFGRDYYVRAMYFAAKAVLVGVLLSTVAAHAHLWLHNGMTEITDALILTLALAYGSLLLVCAAQCLVLYSATPMRHKASIIFCILLFFCSLLWQAKLFSIVMPIL